MISKHIKNSFNNCDLISFFQNNKIKYKKIMSYQNKKINLFLFLVFFIFGIQAISTSIHTIYLDCNYNQITNYNCKYYSSHLFEKIKIKETKNIVSLIKVESIENSTTTKNAQKSHKHSLNFEKIDGLYTHISDEIYSPKHFNKDYEKLQQTINNKINNNESFIFKKIIFNFLYFLIGIISFILSFLLIFLIIKKN